MLLSRPIVRHSRQPHVIGFSARPAYYSTTLGIQCEYNMIRIDGQTLLFCFPFALGFISVRFSSALASAATNGGAGDAGGARNHY